MEGKLQDSSFDNLGIVMNNTLDLDDDFILGDDIETTPTPTTKTPKEKDKPKEETPVVEDDALLGDEEEEGKEAPKEEEDKPVEEEAATNRYQEFGNELLELGILRRDEDEEELVFESGEDIKDRLAYEKERDVRNGYTSYITQQHGDEGLQVFKAIFEDGVSPKEYLAKYASLESVATLDLTSPENQEKIVRQLLQRQKLPQEKIDAKIERMKNYEDLATEAEEAKTILTNLEQEDLIKLQQEQQRTKQERAQQNQERFDAIKGFLIESLKTKSVDGLPLSETDAQNVLNWATQPKIEYNGHMITEWDKFLLDLRQPKNASLLSKFILLAKNKGDFSKIKTAATSEKKDKLFDKVVTAGKQSQRASTFQQPISKFL